MTLPPAARPSFSLAKLGTNRARPSSAAQQLYMQPPRPAFSAPTRFENMDTINEINEAGEDGE